MLRQPAWLKPLPTASAASEHPWVEGGEEHKEIKKKRCVSLQNKALVKKSVCGRDSVLTRGAWQLPHLHNLSHEESRSKRSN